MKTTCPICGQRRAQRPCARQNQTSICSRCCVAERGAECADCGHYATAEQFRARRAAATRTDPHFIAEISPEVDAAVDRVLELAERGNPARARADLLRLLDEHPCSHMVCFGLGTVHAINGEHQAAIEWFDKALAIFPYFIEAYYNKAVAHMKLLDVANAIRAYRKVVELGDPGDQEVKDARAFLHDAAKTIRQAHGLDLDTYLKSQAAFDRAFADMQRGEWLSALEGFRAVAAHGDTTASTRGNMGLCYAMLGHKAKALAELDRAVALDPNYGPAKINRVAVERMEEGHPIKNLPFLGIDWTKISPRAAAAER